MSPIPVQSWDAKAHEEGVSRVIHLDLSKDLSKLQQPGLLAHTFALLAVAGNALRLVNSVALLH